MRYRERNQELDQGERESFGGRSVVIVAVVVFVVVVVVAVVVEAPMVVVVVVDGVIVDTSAIPLSKTTLDSIYKL